MTPINVYTMLLMVGVPAYGYYLPPDMPEEEEPKSEEEQDFDNLCATTPEETDQCKN